MADFDPDAYLGQGPAKPAAFDPDAYLGQKPPTWGETAVDVGKQLLTKPIAGVESLATGPAQVLGAAGRGVNYLTGTEQPELTNSPLEQKIRSYIPGLAPKDAPAQPLGKLIAEQGGDKGIRQYLPEAQTKAGEYAGTIGEIAPAVAAGPGGLLRKSATAVGAGAASQGAGDVAKAINPALEPYGRMAGALVGGYPVAKGAEIGQNLLRAKASPAATELHTASSGAFKAARDLKVQYDPDAASALQKTITKDLLEEGHRPPLATFERAAELTWEGGVAPTYSDIFRVRKALNKITEKREPNPPFGATEDAVAARRAIDHIDKFLVNPENAMPGFEKAAVQAANLTKQARGDWSAMKRVQTLEHAEENAKLGHGSTGSGANIDNRFRQEAAKILKNPRRARGYTEEDRAMLREIATGTPGRNIARYIGKGTPTGIVSAAGIEYLAHSLGLGPLGHAATIGAAYAGKKAADIGTKMAYKRLKSNIAADSPLGRSRYIPSPGIKPSLPSAILGAEAAAEEKRGGRIDTRQATLRALRRIKSGK